MIEQELVEGGPALAAAGMVHRVYQPQGTGPHRTLVMLHGLGGDESVMWIFARALPAKEQWLILSPRGIAPAPDGAWAWHRRKVENGLPPWEGFIEAADAVARFIRSLPGLYGADLGRVYLAGFSQGGAAALATAIRHRELVAGLVMLMSFQPPETPADVAASALAGLPVFMAAGRQDTTLPLPAAQESAGAIRAAGAQLDYREYEAAHKMSVEAMDDLKNWWRQFA